MFHWCVHHVDLDLWARLADLSQLNSELCWVSIPWAGHQRIWALKPFGGLEMSSCGSSGPNSRSCWMWSPVYWRWFVWDFKPITVDVFWSCQKLICDYWRSDLSQHTVSDQIFPHVPELFVPNSVNRLSLVTRSRSTKRIYCRLEWISFVKRGLWIHYNLRTWTIRRLFERTMASLSSVILKLFNKGRPVLPPMLPLETQSCLLDWYHIRVTGSESEIFTAIDFKPDAGAYRTRVFTWPACDALNHIHLHCTKQSLL